MTEFRLFGLIIISEFLLGVGLVLSLMNPNMRLWPPPSGTSWQIRFVLSLTFIAMVGSVPLGILNWNSFLFNHWSRYLTGGAMSTAGLMFALWGTKSLSVYTSLGLEGELIMTGVYKYSRNPQYVGWMAFFIGFAVLCNSLLTLVASLVGSLLFVLASLAEEPYLYERYGPKYHEYVAQVPRFISFHKRGDRSPG